jgi:hypothetical protein
VSERKRSYKMGHRNSKDFTKTQGQLSKSRWAWVKVYFGQFVIWGDYAEDGEGNSTDQLLDIKLLHPIPNRPPVTWNLTACTEEELISLKHLFDTAIEWALPIARQRDKEAQDAFDNGDDSHSRIYRQVPQLVYRSGPVGEHSEGVHDGPSDADGVPRDGRDLDGDLRGEGSDVAERDEGEGGSEDDGAATD